ncbi:MAG: DNA-3-methyladenine glycosylase I [Phycisphaeraceae bacterium]|nr:DNA-3-methyladenine glycosylase I [Phycisphaeraceae bacterium]
MPRCPWARTDLSIPYHDHEWGVPCRDDRHLFEMLILEGAQAGLSWETILAKREAYREAFDDFDVARVARFTPRRVESLLKNPGIVRNRLKVTSAIDNARAVLALRDAGLSLSDHLWSFVGGAPIRNRPRVPAEVPATAPPAEAMSKDLKQRGMRFVGPTILYAFMQATGMVNDHLVSCPRHGACAAMG